MLSVSPIADSMMIAPSTDSGIEIAMMTVERQRGDNAFGGDPLDRAANEHRLVADKADLQGVRQRILDVDHLLLDAGDDIER
jgi:ABC-type phosphate transport system auxiliary subunit